MHKPSLAQIVHRASFPRQRTSDPATFAAHIALNLVPEVRIETSTFYGSLDSVEAQYPGLDYSYGPHRMRLSRFPWHYKLFKVFDELGLSEEEISSLCRWEGTKSARQRYEKEEGVKVRDTTAEAIRPASPSPLPSVIVHVEDGPEPAREERMKTAALGEAEFEDGAIDDRGVDCELHPQEGEDSSDDDMESCGVELNHRLLAATAAREQGANVPLDEDWEQWLKEAGERGSYTDVLNAIRSGQPLNFLYDLPASMHRPARASVQHSVSFSEPLNLPTPPTQSGSDFQFSKPPGSTMIKAIFYSKFDTQEGPKVVHQVPDGAIIPSVTPPSQPLFLTFSDISFFVIPRQELCGNLIQVCTNGFRILGYPICMKSPRYDRNEFIFNFCLVLAEEEDFSSYKSVVQKLADLMHGLEEQSGFLSKDYSKSGEGKVYSLCETLMEDLNNYCECMIPIDELNTLNIKLFPVYPTPPPVRAWQVPLFTVRYQAFLDENWDLTMQRIVPHINGVNSVRVISFLADTDFSLTCRAIRHLLYYGCLFLLDIFSFSAIYAPTALFSSTIAADESMQQECARYVNTLFASSMTAPTAPPVFSSGYNKDDVWPLAGDPTPSLGTDSIMPTTSENLSPTATPSPANTSTIIASAASTTGRPANQFSPDREVVDGVGIVELYASLKQGQSVKQWYLQHTHQLTHIDIRRFITFGIIKGFLYRVHKYAVATGNPAPQIKSGVTTPRSHYHSTPHSGTSSRGPGTGANSPYASSAGDEPAPISQHHHHHHHRSEDARDRASVHSGGRSVLLIDEEDEEDFINDKDLSKYLDGMHCFDQICTELEISERELTTRLKRYHGEVLIIHR
ncbi:nitrogen permease regulating protein NPR2 [Aspergillus lucknowensis]|uniref:Nitrogen permease regulator 2-domain-containing protein n=1 Tax=Aspergillus lucknowensis TaxID=176173 RepID=A0ABR4LWA8_9EURO